MKLSGTTHFWYMTLCDLTACKRNEVMWRNPKHLPTHIFVQYSNGWRLAIYIAITKHSVEGLVQDCSITSSLSIEILQSRKTPSIYYFLYYRNLINLNQTIFTCHTLLIYCGCRILHFQNNVPSVYKPVSTLWKSIICLGMSVHAVDRWDFCQSVHYSLRRGFIELMDYSKFESEMFFLEN